MNEHPQRKRSMSGQQESKKCPIVRTNIWRKNREDEHKQKQNKKPNLSQDQETSDGGFESSYDPESINIWSKRREEYEQRSSPNPNSQPMNSERLLNSEDNGAEDSSFNSPHPEEVSNKELWRTKVSQRNLIVNYLSPCVTDKDLYKAFRPFGKIQSVRVMKDLKAGYSYGFGFVNFFEDEDGEKAKDALNDSELRNKKIKVSYARAACEDTQQSNLYISNLPRSTTEDDVLKMFSAFGEVLQFKLLRDKILNIPRGVAFVRYRERNDALRAVIGMNGFTPEGFHDPIKVRIAMDYGRQRAVSFNTSATNHRHEQHQRPSQNGHKSKKPHVNYKGNLHGQATKSTTNFSASSTKNTFLKKNQKNFHGKHKGKTHKRKFRK